MILGDIFALSLSKGTGVMCALSLSKGTAAMCAELVEGRDDLDSVSASLAKGVSMRSASEAPGSSTVKG